MTMKSWFARRYLDLLGSIYIYNEHRGYTALDRVLEAVKAKHPEATELIAAVEKHRADERKHYTMFKRWFQLRGTMPIALDRTFGHIDRFIEISFGTSIDSLDTDAIIASDDLFERLCRVVSLTEKRGLKQVDILLNHPIVKQDKALHKIFEVVHVDEPDHFLPYDKWLAENQRRTPNMWERWTDRMIHSELLFIKLPLLFLWFGAPRRPNGAMRAKTIPSQCYAASRSPETLSVLNRFLTRRAGGMLLRNTVVSTGVFLVGLGVLWLLVEQAGMDPVIATGISFMVANSIHYVFGRTWIFAGSDRKVSTGYLLFLGNAVVGLAVTVGLFWVLTHWTPMNYLVARVVVSVFAGLAVFALNAAFNFRQL